jgi:hypothetical protein
MACNRQGNMLNRRSRRVWDWKENIFIKKKEVLPGRTGVVSPRRRFSRKLRRTGVRFYLKSKSFGFVASRCALADSCTSSVQVGRLQEMISQSDEYWKGLVRAWDAHTATLSMRKCTFTSISSWHIERRAASYSTDHLFHSILFSTQSTDPQYPLAGLATAQDPARCSAV